MYTFEAVHVLGIWDPCISLDPRGPAKLSDAQIDISRERPHSTGPKFVMATKRELWEALGPFEEAVTKVAVWSMTSTTNYSCNVEADRNPPDGHTPVYEEARNLNGRE